MYKPDGDGGLDFGDDAQRTVDFMVRSLRAGLQNGLREEGGSTLQSMIDEAEGLLQQFFGLMNVVMPLADVQYERREDYAT
jgi:hypothetical protein